MLCRHFSAGNLPAGRRTRAVLCSSRSVCRRQHVSAQAAVVASSCSPVLDSKWQPLLNLVVDETRTFLGDTSLSDEHILGLLGEQQLLARPELYQHVNSFLRRLKVRTVVGSNLTHTSGISYVDPRCPPHITHINSWWQAGIPDASPLITCAENVFRLGHQLKYPDLFCVAILHGPWSNSPQPSERYKLWPLECCFYDATGSILPRAGAGDGEWPVAPRGHWMFTNKPDQEQPRMPTWVAALWDQTRSTCPADPTSTPPATASPGPAAAMPAPLQKGHRGGFSPYGDTTASGGDITDGSTRSSTSSSSGGGATQPRCLAYKTGINLDRLADLNVGFCTWANQQLYPREAEQKVEHDVVKAVGRAASIACQGQPWSVTALRTVGSFNKNTSLRNAHDLDLLVELRSDDFEVHTWECLNRACKVLCSPAPAPISPDVSADANDPTQCISQSLAQSGWKLEAKSAYWVWLSHPKTGLQLDIKTSPCLNVFGAAANGKWHQPVLQHMIKRAKAEQLGEGAPFFSLTLLESYTHPRSSNKEHSSLLTPLLIQLVKGTNDRFAEEYGVRSAGNLVTTVIRATKAWSKGLVAVGQLQQPATSVHSGPGDGCSSNVDGSAETCLPAFRSTAAAVGAAPTAAAGTAKNAPAYPPGYVWEIFVLFVLERQLKQCRDESASAAVYSMHLGPLTLFMDVLLAASQLLRHTGWDQPEPGPIAVYYFFTEEECTLFRRNWGPVGPLYTPYIIHPADPRYNCVMHAGFARWGALADEAGLLHQQMQQLLYPQDEGVVGVGGNARVAGGSSGSGDVWQLIVDTTSLGAAVRAGNGT